MKVDYLLPRLDLELEGNGWRPRDRVPTPAGDFALQLASAEVRGFAGSGISDLYKIQDGESYLGSSFIFGQTDGWIFPLKFALSERRKGRNYYDMIRKSSANQTYDTIGDVTCEVWGSGWFPIMLRGVLWVCDFEPVGAGIIGQVVISDPENQRNRVVANSFEDLIERQIEIVRSGMRDVDESDIG